MKKIKPKMWLTQGKSKKRGWYYALARNERGAIEVVEYFPFIPIEDNDGGPAWGVVGNSGDDGEHLQIYPIDKVERKMILCDLLYAAAKELKVDIDLDKLNAIITRVYPLKKAWKND